ncbi:hypothetical protein BDZ97DRAFT_2077516 [Flammula alnicola]|nr:hypothetical protein BDZ97DRAFT_2077516 [Flammula alnicola]
MHLPARVQALVPKFRHQYQRTLVIQICIPTLEGKFKISDLFKALGRMPLLEDLTISAGVAHELDLDDGHPPPSRIPFLDSSLEVQPQLMAQLEIRGLERYVQGYFLSDVGNTQIQGFRMDLTDYRIHLQDRLPLLNNLISRASTPTTWNISTYLLSTSSWRGEPNPSLILDLPSLQCHLRVPISVFDQDGQCQPRSNGNADLNHFLLALASVEEMCNTVVVLQAMLNNHNEEENASLL